MSRLVTLALVAALAMGTRATAAGAQRTRDSVDRGLDGRVTIKVKVDGDAASTAKISGDSAQTIAIGHVKGGGRVSSGELELKNGRLVYDIHVVPTGKKKRRDVRIDAVTGEVIAAKRNGRKNRP